MINTTSRLVTTLAGGASSGSADGTGTAASFNGINGLAISGAGDFVVVADQNNNLIRTVTVPGGKVTNLAGSLSVGAADGTGTAATFNSPSSTALTQLGDVAFIVSGCGARYY